MAMMASASSGPTENGAGQPAMAPTSRGAALKLLAAKGGLVGLGATWAHAAQRSQVRFPLGSCRMSIRDQENKHLWAQMLRSHSRVDMLDNECSSHIEVRDVKSLSVGG